MMPEFTVIFRHCPSCGRRFEIRIIGKKLIDEKEETKRMATSYSSVSPYYNELSEDVPLTVEAKEFQYTYECKHCGHRWMEAHTQESETKPL
jgi:transcription elongation factor Elf1